MSDTVKAQTATELPPANAAGPVAASSAGDAQPPAIKVTDTAQPSTPSGTSAGDAALAPELPERESSAAKPPATVDAENADSPATTVVSSAEEDETDKANTDSLARSGTKRKQKKGPVERASRYFGVMASKLTALLTVGKKQGARATTAQSASDAAETPTADEANDTLTPPAEKTATRRTSLEKIKDVTKTVIDEVQAGYKTGRMEDETEGSSSPKDAVATAEGVAPIAETTKGKQPVKAEAPVSS